LYYSEALLENQGKGTTRAVKSFREFELSLHFIRNVLHSNGERAGLAVLAIKP